jgi:hypothetical protein
MSESINCGRCAHLWKKHTVPSLGYCGCHARKIQTGQIKPVVDLSETCEHAKLSAKFDPDANRRFYESVNQHPTENP